MEQRTYNNFTAGVQQDDFFTNGANFIEQKNIDGLRDGYGVTLGPKINKLFTSGTNALRALYLQQEPDGDLSESYAGGDNGVIYRLNATDNTPTHTLVTGRNIVAIESFGNDLLIFCKNNLSDFNILVAKISTFNANNDNWGEIDEEFIVLGDNLGSISMPPILRLGGYLYTTGSGSSIKQIDGTGVTGSFGFPDDNIIGLTLQGSTVVVYCRNGNVYFWDGVSTTYSAVKNMKVRLSKVVSKGGMDYITTEDGQLYLGSGLSFQRLTKPKKSNRMDSNSSYDTRLSFTQDDFSGSRGTQNRLLQVALDDVYIYSNDSVKGLYKYGNLIPGMQAGLHKIMTQSHDGTQIEYIYDMMFYERTLKRLYISYKAGSTYGIDYMDLNTLETCTDGYMISEVFTGGTSLKKSLKRLRIATSNTSGNNFIKLYYRINNGNWVLIRNINNAEDEIFRENMKGEADTSAFMDFIDIQLKIELHNDTGGENAPTLHEIMQEYEAIET